MKKITLTINFHIPYILNNFTFFDIKEQKRSIFNEEVLKTIIEHSYKSKINHTIDVLSKILEIKNCNINLSFSGTTIEIFKKYLEPQTLELKKLISKNNLNIICENYTHSILFSQDLDEFKSQTKKNKKQLEELFNVKVKYFKNTEFTYSSQIIKNLNELGFKSILINSIINYNQNSDNNFENLNFVYKLKKDMTYNSHSVENIIFDPLNFSNNILDEIYKRILNSEVEVISLSNVEKKFDINELNSENLYEYLSIIDNDLQRHALEKVYKVGELITQNTKEEIINEWRKMQSIDHIYLMSSKHFNSDEYQNKVLNLYQSPYEAFICYMNSLKYIENKIYEGEDNNIIQKQSKQEQVMNT